MTEKIQDRVLDTNSTDIELLEQASVAEQERVVAGLTAIIDEHNSVLTLRGKTVGPDKLTVRRQAQARELFSKAMSLVEASALSDANKAELIMHIAQSLTGHLDEDERSALAVHVRMDVLPDLFGKAAYMRLGRELAIGLQAGPIELGDDNTVPDYLAELSSLPEAIRSEVIGRFVDLKLLKKSDEGILTFGGAKAAERLRTGSVEVARMASRIISAEIPSEQSRSLDDIETKYRLHDEKSKVATIEVASSTQVMRVLPINELRLGHQDGRDGLALVRETIDTINLLPPEEKPTVILVTNLIQGEFAHLQSARRTSLVEGIDSNDAQFNDAKLLLDELRATGIPVVLSLGRDDHRIAKDNAIDIMKELRGLAKQAGQENHVAYYDVNKLQQDPRFQAHLSFQIKYALPLSYMLGRDLRTADQMMRDTKGIVTTSEELALYAYVMHGEPLPPEMNVDPQLLVGIGEWHDNMCIVDDFNLELSTEASSMEIWYRHSIAGFTPETLLQNHMGSLVDALGAMGTNGAPMPGVLVTGGQQEGIAATRGGSSAISLPGLANPGSALQRSQMYSAVPGDPSRRMNTLRKRPSDPALTIFEQWDTGETAISYVNDDLMERADSIPRTAVIELCDFQMGSPTARPDYQIKYLSYILELAKHMPIAIHFAGDIIHGHIYPGFSDESQAVGLIKIESQKLMMTTMLQKAFWAVPDSILNNIVDILVQQGNHDEIQRKRVPNNNDNNIDYITTQLQWLLGEKPGQQDSRVRHNSVFYTETGVPVPTWMGRSHYGEYEILTAHYHMMKLGKGGGGGLPVYDAYKRAVGLAGEERANIFMGAHWHNPQSALLGKKLVVVGGAMAEQSQFEDMLGYSAALAGTITFMGGGKPVKVVSIGARALDNQGVKHGWYTPENLADNGFHDDPGFDVRKHGPYMPSYMPKSALIKALDIDREMASRLDVHKASRESNVYDMNRQPVNINPQTQRIMARGATNLVGIGA